MAATPGGSDDGAPYARSPSEQDQGMSRAAGRLQKRRDDYEAQIRLEAAGVWIDHALAGDCTTEDAIEAVTQLTTAARSFAAGEVA